MSFSLAGKLEKKSKGPGLICHSAIKISNAEWREQHELCGELMAPFHPVPWYNSNCTKEMSSRTIQVPGTGWNPPTPRPLKHQLSPCVESRAERTKAQPLQLTLPAQVRKARLESLPFLDTATLPTRHGTDTAGWREAKQACTGLAGTRASAFS